MPMRPYNSRPKPVPHSVAGVPFSLEHGRHSGSYIGEIYLLRFVFRLPRFPQWPDHSMNTKLLHIQQRAKLRTLTGFPNLPHLPIFGSHSGWRHAAYEIENALRFTVTNRFVKCSALRNKFGCNSIPNTVNILHPFMQKVNNNSYSLGKVYK